MVEELSLIYKEKNEPAIKQAVEESFSGLTCSLARGESNFPNCCIRASHLLHLIIKKNTGLDTKICCGTRYETKSNHYYPYHAWLEYGDLIIDPTDYQFTAIDLWSLPFTKENITPNNICLDNCTQREIDNIRLATFFENAKRRYKENPNDKEQEFLKIVELFKQGKINSDNFTQLLREVYNSKIFYSKQDKEISYQTRESYLLV